MEYAFRILLIVSSNQISWIGAEVNLPRRRGIQRDPLAGRVKAEFAIDDRGAVSQVSMAGSGVGDPAVLACVERIVRGLGFPAPIEGPVSVTLEPALQSEQPSPPRSRH